MHKCDKTWQSDGLTRSRIAAMRQPYNRNATTPHVRKEEKGLRFLPRKNREVQYGGVVGGVGDEVGGHGER